MSELRLLKKRAAFSGLKRDQYQRNVRFHSLYLARLCVTYKKDVPTFTHLIKLRRFFDQRFSKEYDEYAHIPIVYDNQPYSRYRCSPYCWINQYPTS